jgi:hypothetical protein
VLPEDDANRQLAKGFHLQVPWNRQRQMQVLPVAGGRNKVLNVFKLELAMGMENCRDRFMVLLIDFDGDVERLTKIKAEIPARLTDRVFILGALTTPEALRQAKLGFFEDIGRALGEDCREETDSVWGHELLKHNAGELDRLRSSVRPILFPST